jgi:L-alanine-DL-glutamate epimerase-like enolase superfamily enzyme
MTLPRSLPERLVVREARAEIYRAPLRVPFRIATGQHDALENVLLRLHLEGGTTGWGEAAVARHITGETLPRTFANLKRAARALPGCDLTDYVGVCATFRPFFPGNPAALAALEMAVLDAVARSLEFPFWRFFGSRPASCTTDITIVLGSVEEAAAAARRFYRRGFRTFKIKIGTSEELDLARAVAVAQNAPHARLLLDANQGFDAARMLRFLRILRRHGILPRLLEQPVPRGDWEGLARLTRESGICVCADESVRSLAEAVFAARSKAVNAINIKFAKSGLLEAAEIARFARAAGLRLMMGAMMESALSITAAAHFAAGLGPFDFVDLDTTYFLKGRHARAPYLDGLGRFDLSEAGPGIGITPPKCD